MVATWSLMPGNWLSCVLLLRKPGARARLGRLASFLNILAHGTHLLDRLEVARLPRGLQVVELEEEAWHGAALDEGGSLKRRSSSSAASFAASTAARPCTPVEASLAAASPSAWPVSRWCEWLQIVRIVIASIGASAAARGLWMGTGRLQPSRER